MSKNNGVFLVMQRGCDYGSLRFLVAVSLAACVIGGCIWRGIQDPEWAFTSSWSDVQFESANETSCDSISFEVDNGAGSLGVWARFYRRLDGKDSALIRYRIVVLSAVQCPTKLKKPVFAFMENLRITVLGREAELDRSVSTKGRVKLRECKHAAYASLETALPVAEVNPSPGLLESRIVAQFFFSGVFTQEERDIGLGLINAELIDTVIR